MDIQKAIAQVVDGLALTQQEAYEVMSQIMSGGATDAQIAAFITGLRCKGETVDEIAGAALAMREKATRIQANGLVVDTCGTGGDASGTFNISTTVAIVVAACGVTVAKHGNRAISSQSGSADLLKALGVNIDVDLATVVRSLQEIQLAFLFAPKHHGAMKYAAGPRREIAIRTIFNLLGPLTNPAGADRQLMGVFNQKWVSPMAHVLKKLGSKRAMVVHGLDGLDEITTTSPTLIAELTEEGVVIEGQIDPTMFGLPMGQSSDLKGGNAQENALITQAILNGELGPKRNIVLLNAAAALYLAGQVNGILAGIPLAQQAIDSGAAWAKLQALVAITNG